MKILVVDDSETNLLLIESIFVDDPEHQVILEKDSKKAMQQIKEKIPDVIVLDLMMPKVDGLSILRDLKKDKTLEKIPVIVLTAKKDTSTKIDALNIGANDYILKPLKVDLLYNTVVKYAST